MTRFWRDEEEIFFGVSFFTDAFNLDEKATEQQMNIRKSWLGSYKLEAEMKK